MATSLIHPSTYINKVVVGSSNGSLGIWNIRTAACVHVFPHTLLSPVPSSSLLPSAASTSLTTQTTQPAGAAITALDQSPAIDVLAVGTADGRCALVDVRLGEELVSVRMGGAAFGGVEGEVEGITAIAFRAGETHSCLIQGRPSDISDALYRLASSDPRHSVDLRLAGVLESRRLVSPASRPPRCPLSTRFRPRVLAFSAYTRIFFWRQFPQAVVLRSSARAAQTLVQPGGAQGTSQDGEVLW